MAEKLTQFDYLLNAFELASQHADPAPQGYAEKRKALFAYVRELEAFRDDAKAGARIDRLRAASPEGR